MQPGTEPSAEKPTPKTEEPQFFERGVAVLFFLLVCFCALVLSYGVVSLLVTGTFFANPMDHLLALEGAVGFGVIAGLMTYRVFADWRKRRKGYVHRPQSVRPPGRKG